MTGNMMRRYIWGLIIVLLAPFFLYADLSVEDVIDSLTLHYKNFNTIHAYIKQTIKRSTGKAHYEGEYWAKGNRMYLEYHKPYLQKIWMDEDSVVWYIPSKNKIYVSSKKEYGNNSVSTSNVKNIVNDIEKELEEYMKISIKEKGVIKKKYVISIIPKDRSNKGGLQVIVDKDKFLLNDYIIYDNNAQEVLHFSFKKYIMLKDNVMLPTEVVSKWYMSGYMEIKTVYDKIDINIPVSDSFFLINIPDSVDREPLKLF